MEFAVNRPFGKYPKTYLMAGQAAEGRKL